MVRKTIFFFAMVMIVSSQFSTALNNGGEQVQALELKLSDSSVTVNVGDSFTLTANLTDDGNFVSGATFETSDNMFDISESVNDLDNGTYIITFTSGSTTVTPGNYSIDIVASKDSLSATVALTLIINPIETDAPELQLISNGDKINGTTYFLEVNASDDTQWYDINVTVGGFQLYYFVNPFPVEDNLGSITYNKTHISYSEWIQIDFLATNFQFTENLIRITVRDTSLNKNSTQIEFIGEYSPPVVSFTSHENEERIFSRNIILEWTVEDNSAIVKQELFINNKKYIPNSQIGEKEIDGSTRAANITLVIPLDQPQIILLRMIAIDEYGNRGEASLTIIYDTSKLNPETSNPINGSSISGDQLLIGGGILLLILAVVGIIIFLRSREKEHGIEATYTAELSQKVETLFNYHPGDTSVDLANINLILSNYAKKIAKVKGKEKIKSLLSDLEKELDSLMIGDLTFNDQLMKENYKQLISFEKSKM